MIGVTVDTLLLLLLMMMMMMMMLILQMKMRRRRTWTIFELLVTFSLFVSSTCSRIVLTETRLVHYTL